MSARQGVRMFPIRCPDNSDMLSGCFRNQCPDVAEIRTLTTNHDSIPMWNYYSDQSGVAIGFNIDILISTLHRILNNTFLINSHKMEYNIDHQNNIIQSCLKEISNISDDPKYGRDDFEIFKIRINEILSRMWSIMCTLVKTRIREILVMNSFLG